MEEKTVVLNGYEFSIDQSTGTTTARGSLQNEAAKRDGAAQANAGGAARTSTDQGGHLVGARMNGPSTPENLFAQDGHLNQGPYKTVENAEYRLISDPEKNASIQTERTAYMSHPSSESGNRPDAFMVNDSITYPDGQTQNVNLSFANMTVEAQENINYDLNTRVEMEDLPNPGDTLRERMSPEEYTEFMEKTDEQLPSIRDEFGEQISINHSQETGVVDIQTEMSTSDWEFQDSQNLAAVDENLSESWDFADSCEADTCMEGADISIEGADISAEGADMSPDDN